MALGKRTNKGKARNGFSLFFGVCFGFFVLRPNSLSLLLSLLLSLHLSLRLCAYLSLGLRNIAKLVIRQSVRVNAHIYMRFNPIQTYLFSRVPRAIVGLSFD